MKDKLTIEHLAPYLPYNLNGKYQLNDVHFEYPKEIRDKQLRNDNVNFFLRYCKPILRPLSDLTKEIEHNGESICPLDYWDGELKGSYINKELKNMAQFDYFDGYLPYNVAKKLFEWHFDVYGLIKKGLAIDIKTIENNSK